MRLSRVFLRRPLTNPYFRRDKDGASESNDFKKATRVGDDLGQGSFHTYRRIGDAPRSDRGSLLRTRRGWRADVATALRAQESCGSSSSSKYRIWSQRAQRFSRFE